MFQFYNGPLQIIHIQDAIFSKNPRAMFSFSKQCDGTQQSPDFSVI